MTDSLGLKRGVAKLVNYNPKWQDAFLSEKEFLLKNLGNKILTIEHIGSTSIPGLSAKPIIDMLAAVRSLSEIEELKPILEKLGYKYRENAGNAEQRMFAKGSEEKRTHYLHITEFNSPTWKRDLNFRDYLRIHRETKKEYEKLKLALAIQHENNRALYTEGKAQFIRSVLEKC